MKKILTSLAVILFTLTVIAQSPSKISYQAIVRNAENNLVTDANISVMISILQGIDEGTMVYQETHSVETNMNGLFTIEIGSGNSSNDFASIDWSLGTYAIQTDIDIEGGENYTISNVSELLSVPFSLHANTADSIVGGITENDPIFTSWDKSSGVKITEAQITDLKAYLLEEKDSSATNELQSLSQVLAINDSANAQIKNLADPTDAKDAATKAYVDDIKIIALKDSSIVNELQGLYEVLAINDSANAQIKNLTEPTDDKDAATKAYVDALKFIIDSLAGELNKINAVLENNGLLDKVTDIDGNSYKTVTIGGQVWMAENLRTSKYNTGAAITLVSDNSIWGSTSSAGYCWLNNDVANKGTHGAIYNAYAVTTGNLCPLGWKIPSKTDFETLITALGGEDVAGGKLKEMGTTTWSDPNVASASGQGFNAKGSGRRAYNTGVFEQIGNVGNYWSSTKSGSTYNNYLLLKNDNDDATIGGAHWNYGLSVRCIKE